MWEWVANSFLKAWLYNGEEVSQPNTEWVGSKMDQGSYPLPPQTCPRPRLCEEDLWGDVQAGGARTFYHALCQLAREWLYLKCISNKVRPWVGQDSAYDLYSWLSNITSPKTMMPSQCASSQNKYSVSPPRQTWISIQVWIGRPYCIGYHGCTGSGSQVVLSTW